MNEQATQQEKEQEAQHATEAPEARGSSRRRRSRQRHLEASVNMDELRELITLIQENGFAEFELEREGFRIHVRRDLGVREFGEALGSQLPAPRSVEKIQAASSKSAGSSTQVATSPVHPGAQAETAASEDQDLYMIPSPIVGTFYRSPSPTADPFVKIGSQVEPDSVVCIIEAMKLMNEIQAETSGEVVKIYVENGQPVEYGQPLFGIRR
jgi:acetyl-CoA carboxylase biotin carboxyl carrier protein